MSSNTNEPDLELYIIRHGQSYGNIGKMPDDHDEFDEHDPRLTPTGIHQAELAGERFSSYPFDAVYASGLRRTIMTATEIVSRQPENGAKEIKILPTLTEVGTSDVYRGQTFGQLKAAYPYATLADGVNENDCMLCFTDGWSDRMQDERARSVIKYIREHHNNGARVALTAHAAFNTFLVLAALELDPEKVKFDPHFLNTGVTKIIFFKDGTGRYDLDIQLVYLNDLSHLYKDYPDIGNDICLM